MAITTTTTISVSGPISAEAARLRRWNHLVDYDLHHSNVSSERADSSIANEGVPRSESHSTNASSLHRALHNPPDWPNNHRRIPAHRPINTQLDQSQRRIYRSTGERLFLTMMFTGVQTVANINRVWNATIGRINDDWFKYKIGGEW